MNKPSYKKAVEWIALNDEPAEVDPSSISELISVVLIADLFNKDPIKVAQDILKFRKNTSEPHQ